MGEGGGEGEGDESEGGEGEGGEEAGEGVGEGLEVNSAVSGVRKGLEGLHHGVQEPSHDGVLVPLPHDELGA